MANPNPKPVPDHVRWKKGQSGNPSGRPKESITLKELKKYTREHIAEVINRLLELPSAHLQHMSKNPDTPVFEQIVARVLLRCQRVGNFVDIDRMLDRIIGKVPQRSETELSGVPLVPPVIQFVGIPPKDGPNIHL